MAGRPSVCSSSHPRIRSTAGDSYTSMPSGSTTAITSVARWHEGPEPLLALAHCFGLRRRQPLRLDHVCLVEPTSAARRGTAGSRTGRSERRRCLGSPNRSAPGAYWWRTSAGRSGPATNIEMTAVTRAPDRPEAQTSQEHRDVEPVRRDDGPAAEEVRRTPACDEQPCYDRQRCGRGQIRQGGPADHAGARRASERSRPFDPYWSLVDTALAGLDSEILPCCP